MKSCIGTFVDRFRQCSDLLGQGRLRVLAHENDAVIAGFSQSWIERQTFQQRGSSFVSIRGKITVRHEWTNTTATVAVKTRHIFDHSNYRARMLRGEPESPAGRTRGKLRWMAGQKQFCARLKIGISRWNQIENCRPLSKGVAFLLVRHFPGITLDWLFLGVTGGLPVNLQREIEAARAEL